jgi:hypothetical protein
MILRQIKQDCRYNHQHTPRQNNSCSNPLKKHKNSLCFSDFVEIPTTFDEEKLIEDVERLSISNGVSGSIAL